MVKVMFDYTVPIDKQAEYFQLTQDKIKPLIPSGLLFVGNKSGDMSYVR